MAVSDHSHYMQPYRAFVGLFLILAKKSHLSICYSRLEEEMSDYTFCNSKLILTQNCLNVYAKIKIHIHMHTCMQKPIHFFNLNWKPDLCKIPSDGVLIGSGTFATILGEITIWNPWFHANLEDSACTVRVLLFFSIECEHLSPFSLFYKDPCSLLEMDKKPFFVSLDS